MLRKSLSRQETVATSLTGEPKKGGLRHVDCSVQVTTAAGNATEQSVFPRVAGGRMGGSAGRGQGSHTLFPWTCCSLSNLSAQHGQKFLGEN